MLPFETVKGALFDPFESTRHHPPSPRPVVDKAKILAERYSSRNNVWTGQSNFGSNSLVFATLNLVHCESRMRVRAIYFPRLALFMASLSFVHMLHLQTNPSQNKIT